MKVYFLSGLGADETVFKRLHLPGIEAVHLNWVVPFPHENISLYAERMAQRIREPEPILVGLSFGGMLAIEIAKLRPVKKVVLISSAKTKNELPLFVRAGRWIPLHKILPVHISRMTAPFLNFLFGIVETEQKEMIRKMVNTCPKAFTRWAINAVVHWENTTVPKNTVHIHGDADRLIPYRNVRPDYTVHNGGHFMIMNQSEELSGILSQMCILSQ